MKLNPISSVCFKGKIIDAHAHIGKWHHDKNFQLDALDTFTKEPLSNGDTVEKMIISNLDSIYADGILDETKGLKEILSATENNPKYAVLAVCQPNKTNGDTKEIDKIIKENKDRIFGLKFHPSELGCKANEECYEKYMEYANTNKLPCLFHTDKSDLSKARDIYNLAKESAPDVPVILGHCGGEDFEDALKVLEESALKNDAKIYCDISWLNWGENHLPDGVHENVKKLITSLKEKGALDRILFGTDAPLGCYGENPVNGVSTKEAYEMTVDGIKKMIKDNFGDEADEIIDKIFYKNADELFFKKSWITNTDNTAKAAAEDILNPENLNTVAETKAIQQIEKENSKNLNEIAKMKPSTKAMAAIGIAFCALGAGYAYLKNKKVKNNDKNLSLSSDALSAKSIQNGAKITNTNNSGYQDFKSFMQNTKPTPV